MNQTFNYINENLINPYSDVLTDLIVDTFETIYSSKDREKVDKKISLLVYGTLISQVSRSACRIPGIHLMDKALIGYCRRYCVVHFLDAASDFYSCKNQYWNYFSSFFSSKSSNDVLRDALRPLVNIVVLVQSYSTLSGVAVSIAVLISPLFAWGVFTACMGLAGHYYCKQIHPEVMRYVGEYDRLEKYVQCFAKNNPQL